MKFRGYCSDRLWRHKRRVAGLQARPSDTARLQRQAGIRSGHQLVKGTALSSTLALASTKSVTLFSITMASTSAMRLLSLKYQRTTSAGFS